VNGDMSQYKELFVETAKGYLNTLNEELLRLEKSTDHTVVVEAIDAIFRAAHSLKGQSAAMGYEQTGYLCHVIEDVFYEIKENRRTVDPDLADVLFQAFDSLSGSVARIESEGSESDVGGIADQLKRLTGLQTTGSGHTAHEESTAAPAPFPQTAEQPMTQITTQVEVSASPIEKRASSAAPHHSTTIKTIPVKVEQLDDIVGSLEELMVDRLTMQGLVDSLDNHALSQAQDKISDLIELLQFQIMKIRAVPLSVILEHFPRAVRDLGRMLNKEIELHIHGGDLELDRTIVEGLDEPLTHIIRNAADHGIGASGTITISARAGRDSAIVSVSDNGAGIDWDAVAKKAGVDPRDKAAVKKALFSGVSTAKEVSLISGRGVGMEAVKQAVQDLGGTIDVSSVPGKGTTFTLKLPFTLSVVRTLIVRVSDQRYAIAATAVDRSLRLSNRQIVKNVGQEVFRHEDQEIPLIRLKDVFGLTSSDQDTPSHTYAVILNVDSERIALAVDAVSETLETVIRPLPGLLRGSPLFSGVAVVGDGSSALLINPRGFSDE